MHPSHQYYWAYRKVKECIHKYMMSKDETLTYLEDQQGIVREDTCVAWAILEHEDPDFFRSYSERIHERNARTRERVASTSPRERNSAIVGEQEQQQQSRPRGLAILLPDLNVPAADAIAVHHPSTQAGPSRAGAANADAVVESQNLQASQQQQPVIPNDFCQQVLNTLGQVLNALGQLQSNSDYIMKQLTTDGHGFAAGSSKRQRVGEAELRGDHEEETEKLQEGDGEETEKLQEGDGGEAEKQQEEKEEGNDDEEAEKPQEKEEEK